MNVPACICIGGRFFLNHPACIFEGAGKFFCSKTAVGYRAGAVERRRRGARAGLRPFDFWPVTRARFPRIGNDRGRVFQTLEDFAKNFPVPGTFRAAFSEPRKLSRGFFQALEKNARRGHAADRVAAAVRFAVDLPRQRWHIAGRFGNGDDNMSENKQMTTGGRNFCLLLMLLGIATALCGAWSVLYPPPNPQTFMTKVGELIMVGSGTAIAFGALLILAVKGRK